MTCNIIIQIVSMDRSEKFSITNKPFDPVACRPGALGRIMSFTNAQSCQCVAMADEK